MLDGDPFNLPPPQRPIPAAAPTPARKRSTLVGQTWADYAAQLNAKLDGVLVDGSTRW
jgi:hypothetical protein